MTKSTQGNTTHCETVLPLAGQRKATKGKAGVSLLVAGSTAIVPLELLEEISLRLLFLGRWLLAMLC